MNDIAMWIFDAMATIILGFLAYFFKENISALKSLKKVVEDMIVKFAVHEEANKSIVKLVDNHENRISNIENCQVELKLKINSNETILKQLRDGTYN